MGSCQPALKANFSKQISCNSLRSETVKMLVDSSIKPEIPAWLGQDATELSTGTTLVAMEYKDGVILAADSRTSTGTFVAVRVTDKLTPVTSHTMVCRSGSAADTQAMTDAVKDQLEWYEIEFGNPPPVHTAAHLFKNIGYEYRDQFTAGLIVAGWDKEKGGQVYSVPIGGALVRQPASIGGSGSTYLYGFLDAHYKEGMDKEKCVELAKQCVTLAITRDGASGGCVRIAVITKDGVERRLFLNNELPEFVKLCDMPAIK